MNDVIQKIYDIGIVPVIAIDDADKAVPLAKALVKGGLPAAEVTFRTAAAEEAIKRIVAEVPEMLVGAGTVLTKEQADRAIAAGVKFIVSPGFNPEITKYVIDKGMLMMPGTATPGEMEQAMSMGLDVVKFFPAEQNGGVAKLKAVAGPYTNLRWMPTGGVNAKNLLDYLSFNKIIACGGTWMVKKDLIEAEQWDEITRVCREAVKTMLGFSLHHVGINCADGPFGPLTVIGGRIYMEDGRIFQTMDSRFPTCTNGKKMTEQIRAALGDGAELRDVTAAEPFYIEADSPAILACINTYNEVTGENAKPFTMGGGTYARHFPYAVSFGPEHVDLPLPEFGGPMHGANEAAPIDKLLEAVKIYIIALLRLEEIDF